MEEKREPEEKVEQATQAAGEAGEGRVEGGEAPGEEMGEEAGLWDKVRKGVVEGYQFAADKTDLYTKVGSRRLAIVGINRKIDRAYSDLGEKVYNLMAASDRADVAADPAVIEIVGRIRTLEGDLTGKEAEIEEIRQEFRVREAAKKAEEKGS